jgi:hypothetical protein
MYGEGYDWAQQYSVSSGDFVGSLPVGMQSRGDSDLPYWPSQNMYVYKEVWVHPSARWLWLMADLLGGPAARGPAPPLGVSATTAPNGEVTIRVTAEGEGPRRLALRAEHLAVARPSRTVTLVPGRPTTVEWTGRPTTTGAAWYAVVIPDGDVSRRVEVRVP